MPGQVGYPGQGILLQEARGGQIPQGGAALPQEAHLRCRLQEPAGGFASAFAQRRLTKRSLELRKAEVNFAEFPFHALG
jgi:hypothetical protein